MLRPGVRVRPACSDDAETLIELMRALAHFEDYLDEFKVDADTLRARAFGENAQCHIAVVEWEAQVAGYAVLLEIPFTFDLRPTVLLKELYVTPHGRGNSLGKALMHYVARWALARGAGRLKWDVMLGNEPAEAFYRQLGGQRDKKWIAYHLGQHELSELAMPLVVQRRSSEAAAVLNQTC